MEKERFPEDEMLMISGIQHYAFCRRQWALIHIEQQWAENVLTLEGRLLHRNADDPTFTELRGGVLVSRGMPLVAASLGLYGVADVVEFHQVDGEETGSGIKLPKRRGRWIPYPVEYKRGDRKSGEEDELQLCAQAVALEEMFGIDVPEGALFYGERERRVRVEFDTGLRARLTERTEEMHRHYRDGSVPRATQEPKCRSCSLLNICMPGIPASSTEQYMRAFLGE